jgi:outer membrane protein assembly factor BamB
MQPTLQWVRQFGAQPGEFFSQAYGTGVTVDRNENVYVTGSIGVSGQQAVPNSFLSKYDQAGNLLWTQQIMAPNGRHTFSLDVGVDPQENIVITGTTMGNLASENAGLGDIFVRKYDPGGTMLWTRQFGNLFYDWSYGLDIDVDGNIFLAGNSTLGFDFGESGGFLAKLDPSGELAWHRSPSPRHDSSDIALGADGSSYVAGDYNVPNNDLPQFVVSRQATVTKFDALGEVIWIAELGGVESDEVSSGVAVDAAGNVFLTGFTNGDLAGPNAADEDETIDVYRHDVFVAKFDVNGRQAWVRQFGAAREDWGRAVSVDVHGDIYVTGKIGGLPGIGGGFSDIFISRLDNATGELIWSTQIGTPDGDQGNAIWADRHGNLFVTGQTTGDFGNPSGGRRDAFLLKYSMIPEPSSVRLVVLFSLFAAARRGR